MQRQVGKDFEEQLEKDIKCHINTFSNKQMRNKKPARKFAGQPMAKHKREYSENRRS